MKKMTIEADISRAGDAADFISGQLESIGCPADTGRQICAAADEIFSNIAYYAYGEGSGSATVCVEAEHAPPGVSITFYDSGLPYDPLSANEPDITLPAEERAVGGLGLYIVKKLMDSVSYVYMNGMNVLQIKKYWNSTD